MFEHKPSDERIRRDGRESEIEQRDAGLEGIALPAIPSSEAPRQNDVARQDGAPQLEAKSSTGIVRRLSTAAARAFDVSMDWIASDPKAQVSIVRAVGALGVDLLPFVGPLKKYADARAMFKDGDPLLKEEARKLVVIAAAEGAFDAVTMGGSAFVPDEIFTYLRYARDWHRRVAGITRASRLLPDPLSLAAGALLKIPPVRAAADRALELGASPVPQS